jgi:SAM-dependent methyltransferase
MDYSELNRQAWDEAAPIHRQHASFAELRERFRQPGYSCLDPLETAILQELGVAGKHVAQLCCNNGRELLSVRNLGAARCVGFDISAAFLALAAELQAAAGTDCSFVRGDVLAIPAAYDASFDLVTVTIGVLGWMVDVAPFFGVAARLLRPGGRLFVHEQHPMCDMFDPNDPAPLTIRHGYFRREPYVTTDGLDYLGNVPYASKPSYWFHHTLGDIIGAVLAQGLALERFREYPHDIASAWADLEQSPTPPPLSYALLAQKPQRD